MKMLLSELRRIVREASNDCWGGSNPEELYEQELEDDDSMKKKSVFVPDDIKKSISKWSHAMGLSGTKARHRPSKQ